MAKKPNEKQMEFAYHRLALDGYWGSVREQMGTSKLEKMLEKEATEIAKNLPPSIVNSVVAYGVTRKDMSGFKNNQPGNYEALERILIGIHNINVPHKILRELNSSEILALYLGIGQLKTYGRVKKGHEEKSYTNIMKMDFADQMSLLISYGYRYNGIRIMKNSGFREHLIGRGELKKRMSEIHPSVQRQFVDSLKKPTVKSNRYDRINGFYDPNPEGLKDWTAKNIYVNHIVKLLEDIHQKNKAF